MGGKKKIKGAKRAKQAVSAVEEEMRRLAEHYGLDADEEAAASEETRQHKTLKSKRKAQQAGQPRPASSSMMNKPKQS